LDVVARIESSLVAGGFRVTRDSVAGRQAVIGRKAALRSSTFVLVAVFKADATPVHLDRFVEEAAQYARTVGGGVRLGRRLDMATVAVAVVDSAGEVGGWGQTPTSAWPVLVDLAERRVTQPRDVAPTMARLVGNHVVPALGPPAGS